MISGGRAVPNLIDDVRQRRGGANYGPELACGAMAEWAGRQVGLHFIPPGEPWRNG
jgi:hypothetical protein